MFSEDFLKSLIAIHSRYHIEAMIAQWRSNHSQLCPTIVNYEYLLPWHNSIPFLCSGATHFARSIGKNGYRHISSSSLMSFLTQHVHTPFMTETSLSTTPHALTHTLMPCMLAFLP